MNSPSDELRRIADRLREIKLRMWSDEDATRHIKRHTAEAARVIQPHLADLVQRAGWSSDAPKILVNETLDPVARLDLWSNAWTTIAAIYGIIWRSTLDIGAPKWGDTQKIPAAHNGATNTTDEGYVVVGQLTPGDWSERVADYADVCDGIAKLMDAAGHDGGLSNSVSLPIMGSARTDAGALDMEPQKVIHPTNQDVARVANLVANGKSAKAASEEVAENSHHSAESLRVMYQTWKRENQV